MRDIALDPVTKDLALVAAPGGGVGFALTVPGADAVRQRLMLRLSLWSGEYSLDRDAGVPYVELLGKGTRAQAEQVLRHVVASCPGVARLVTFRLDVDPATRVATVSFVATTTSGEPVSLDAFRVGA